MAGLDDDDRDQEQPQLPRGGSWSSKKAGTTSGQQGPTPRRCYVLVFLRDAEDRVENESAQRGETAASEGVWSVWVRSSHEKAHKRTGQAKDGASSAFAQTHGTNCERLAPSGKTNQLPPLGEHLLLHLKSPCLGDSPWDQISVPSFVRLVSVSTTFHPFHSPADDGLEHSSCV